MSEFSIGHLEIDSPFGNAGGVIKHLEDVDRIGHTGVGWLEAGSYTREPRAGNGANGEVVYYHDAAEGKTYNALGMPNKGMDVVEKEIPEMARIAHSLSKPLVINVAPVSENPVEESQELVARAYDGGADAVLLNAGCPNVVTEDGGRHEILSHNAEALHLVLDGLKAVTDTYKQIFIRTSPVERDQVKNIAETIRRSRVVSAVFTPNTWPGQEPLDEAGQRVLEVPGGIGGMSGPATAGDAMVQARLMREHFYDVGSDISVVNSGGITNGDVLAQSIRMHGSSAGASTTFFYESGNWEDDVHKLLLQFADSGRR